LARRAAVVAASRHVAAAARFACRPASWVGTAREVALCGFNVATYPLGIRPARPTWHAETDEQSARAKRRLAVDPALAATPVLLVHGYVHNRSAFLAMSRALKRAGFRYVHGFNYNAFGDGIGDSAARLGAEVERILEATGADRVMIVAHSMGGVVARYYVQQLGGEDTVDTVITLGTPHQGTYAAYLGAGPASVELRPGSSLLAGLDASARPGPVRWIAYWSDLDVLIAPVRNARLLTPALAAHNVRVRDTGHMSLLSSGWVMRDVLRHLSDPTLHRCAPGAAALATPAQHHRRPGPAADGAAASAAAASAPAASALAAARDAGHPEVVEISGISAGG